MGDKSKKMPIITTYYKGLFGKKRQVRERFIVDENGVKNGLYQSYHKNGQPAETCTYRDDVKHGSCIIRHENGRVASECMYQDGCREGDYSSYYPDGQIHQKARFARDLYNGSFYMYSPDGSLDSIYSYRNGQKHGLCETRYHDEIERRFYENDLLIRQELVSGSLNTSTTQEVANGLIKKQVNYVYDAERHLIEKVVFEGDYDNAARTTYYQNGSIREQYTTFRDRKEGSYTRCDENGYMIEQANYHAGKLEGKRMLFYPGQTGTVREECEYKAGKLHGLCTRYDEQGHIIERCRYEGDKKVVYPEMVESLFMKQADKPNREALADQLITLRQQGKKTDAVLKAKQFHMEKADVTRRTALKIDGQNYRS